MSAASEIAKLIAQDPEALAALAEALRPLLTEIAPNRVMDTKEAAAYLGLSPDALDRRARQGVIPSMQEEPRCKRFFNRADLDAWRQE